MKTVITFLVFLALQTSVIGQDFISQTESTFNSDSSLITNLEIREDLAQPRLKEDPLMPPRFVKQTYMDIDGNIPALQKRVNDFLRTLPDSKSAVVSFKTSPISKKENPGGPYVILAVLIEYFVESN
ncbi:MAG TPA: hypothetical protein VFG10_09770 [Saprospiraceae bacterium]|nr:hypothetical protein [Saprospiraceae bacterium]